MNMCHCLEKIACNCRPW